MAGTEYTGIEAVEGSWSLRQQTDAEVVAWQGAYCSVDKERVLSLNLSHENCGRHVGGYRYYFIYEYRMGVEPG